MVNYRTDDQRNLQRQALLQAEDQRKAHAQQHYANPHRRCHTEHGADQRDDADAVTQRATHPLAQQWIERRANRQRHAPAIGEIPHRHPQQGVHRPTCDTVMEHRPHHRILDRLGRPSLPCGRRQILHHRSGDRVEQHVDPDARSELHRHPRTKLVLRPRMVRAEPHITFLGQRYPQHKADHQRYRHHVIPTEIGRNPVHSRFH